ncbi:MAG: helicase [Phaeodactylibacter sp.]|nr:helicase [Phaeodactylibacter sp.]
MDYQEFIKSKEFKHVEAGFEADVWNYPLFDYQAPIVKWALKRGKAAIFADTGLGKTIMQLAWADCVAKHTNQPVLVLAPLAVSSQTIEEGQKYGIYVEKLNPDTDVFGAGVYIINYEQLHKVKHQFKGIVLDESSILKGMDGRRRKEITAFAQDIPYRLSCTATPSPNDFMELGTQAEFLGIMSQVEMLAMFFVNDMSDTGKWRLKGHGHKKFFEWLATWSVVIRKPSDLGFDDSKHELPALNYFEHIIETNPQDSLLVEPAQGLQERNKARKESVNERVDKAAEIANAIAGPVLVWCHLNEESEKLSEAINHAMEVKGSDKPEYKEKTLIDFSHSKIKCLVTKPKIAGFGMNWQNCHNIIFVGLSDSWESYYQAVRRCWRFGQTKQVNVHVISADTEGAVVDNIKRKDAQNIKLGESMVAHMKTMMEKEIFFAATEKTEYKPQQKMELPEWLM